MVRACLPGRAFVHISHIFVEKLSHLTIDTKNPRHYYIPTDRYIIFNAGFVIYTLFGAISNKHIKESIRMKTKQSFAPWLMVLGCGLMASTIGIVQMCGGLFFEPVTNDLGIDLTALTLYASIMGFIGAFSTPLVGNLLPKGRTRLLLTGAAILSIVSFGAMSFYTKPWMWYISGAVMGLSNSFLSVVPMTIILNNWFEKKKGFAIALAWVIYDIVVAIASPVFSSLIYSVGWRQTYLICAAVVAVLVLPCTLFIIRFKPEDMGLRAYGAEDSTAAADMGEIPEDALTGISVKTALRSFPFYAVSLVAAIVTIVTCLNQFFPIYASSMNFDPAVGATLISVAMMADIVLNPVIGSSCDKYGVFKVTGVVFFVVIVSYIVLSLSANAVPLAYFGAAINDSMYAFYGTGIALLTSAIFGNKDFSKIYSYISSIGFFIGSFAMTIISGIYQAAGSFNAVLYTMAGGVALSGLLIFVSVKSAAKLERS